MFKKLSTKVPYRSIIVAFCLQLFVFSAFSQKIGLVLSGGGATGLAHIGVLKALEENHIPIDYITGTSAGALIGSMYASGYSPEEIEKIVLSDEFQTMMSGKVEPEYKFILRDEDPSASMFDIGFKKDSIFAKVLPTNWITPAYLDYFMLKTIGATGASKHENFDSLFVPFRCVASDITKKESVIFRSGKLNEAVRASMTFPFFLSPIKVDGKLLFDGGLYNNFPSDVMYSDFNADYIIGSNVSYNEPPPTPDDLLSQVKNMLVAKTTFELPCESGIMISPRIDVSTFEFSKAKEAIEAGYQAALLYIDSIKQHISRRSDSTSLAERRKQFQQNIAPLNISEVHATNERGDEAYFSQHSFFAKRKKLFIDEKHFKRQYFRLYGTPQLSFLYPLIHVTSDSTYGLDLAVRKSKEFRIFAGGHFCTRAVTTGYLGFSFYSIGRAAFGAHVESYFGKFYNSLKANVDFHLPTRLPLTIHPYVVLNRWDYFRSFATFFQEIKPAFLVQNEVFFGSRFSTALSTTTKTSLDFRLFYQNNKYYQTENFSNSDTSDVTYFDGVTLKYEIEKNSLNRKQFASQGHRIAFKAYYVNGREESVSGSTAPEKYDVYKQHEWISLNLDVQYFFLNFKFMHTGGHFMGTFNSQSLFKNYTATMLNTNAFEPIPDAKTIFMSEYRSPQFVGLGINQVFTIKDKFDIRADIYGYQPFKEIVQNSNGTFGYGNQFPGLKWLASASAIYHSPIGPLRLTFNYFPYQKNPYLIQLSFGYVIFNERSTR